MAAQSEVGAGRKTSKQVGYIYTTLHRDELLYLIGEYFIS